MECHKAKEPGHKITKRFLDIPQKDRWLCTNCNTKQSLVSSARLLDNMRFLGNEVGRSGSPASDPPSPGYRPPFDYIKAIVKAARDRNSPPRVVKARRIYLGGSDQERWSSSDSEEVGAKEKDRAVQGGSEKPSTLAGPSGRGAGGDKRKREGASSGSAGGGTSSMSRPKKK